MLHLYAPLYMFAHFTVIVHDNIMYSRLGPNTTTPTLAVKLCSSRYSFPCSDFSEKAVVFKDYALVTNGLVNV